MNPFLGQLLLAQGHRECYTLDCLVLNGWFQILLHISTHMHRLGHFALTHVPLLALLSWNLNLNYAVQM